MSNQKTKLTKTFVDSVPLSPNKQVFYRDSDLIGFALRVTASKVYVVERRIGDGKSSVRVLVGRHGELTPAQAREKAQMLLAQMAAGINPNNEKKKDKDLKLVNYAKETQQPTLMTAYNAYINERELGVKSLEDYRMCVEDYLVEWKDVKLIDITRKMIQEKHVELTIRSKARANLAMRFLRAVFNFSIEHYLDVNDKSILDISNPVNTLGAKKAWNKIRKRKTYINEDQIPDWIRAIFSYEDRGQALETNRDFLLTLVLTGLRREECESLHWSNVDLIYGNIIIKNPENGEHILPMGDFLFELMKKRKRAIQSDWVFPSARSKSGHLENISKVRAKINKLCNVKFTFHDLRRTFGSIAESLDYGQYTIKRLLNHKKEHDNDVTAAYIQVSDKRIREAMNEIEDIILKNYKNEFMVKFKAQNN
ncbi:integrase family protein [Acinetobacter sp. R933-2]|uniref:tyrosine-type recombinase/integrase n=1 Tax=Acinetobacter sp. R933-2 TaxID=2746728 RepID=UPI002576E6EE|nr:tyrosine-type recombinase/integrase [Acinetobacter sp. R933-2]MDM1248883.1 integrase family protein [Acinetobacter sp. R933-2]